MGNPHAGPVIQARGVAQAPLERSRPRQGQRGGVRIIYYRFSERAQFWLFTIYGKDVADDLTSQQKLVLKERLRHEKAQRI